MPNDKLYTSVYLEKIRSVVQNIAMSQTNHTILTQRMIVSVHTAFIRINNNYNLKFMP